MPVPAAGDRGSATLILAATAALIAVILLWTVRDYEHRRAVNALEARTYRGAEPLRASAYPDLTNPFRWYGVVETSNFFVLAPVNSLGPEVNPGMDDENSLHVQYKPEETPITLAAKRSYLGRVYLDWARYPLVQTETLESPEQGYIVDFQDLRFSQLPSLLSRGKTRKALGAGVRLDRDLNVAGDVYDSGSDRVTFPEPR